jgi:hypothetical protein
VTSSRRRAHQASNWILICSHTRDTEDFDTAACSPRASTMSKNAQAEVKADYWAIFQVPDDVDPGLDAVAYNTPYHETSAWPTSEIAAA